MIVVNVVMIRSVMAKETVPVNNIRSMGIMLKEYVITVKSARFHREEWESLFPEGRLKNK